MAELNPTWRVRCFNCGQSYEQTSRNAPVICGACGLPGPDIILIGAGAKWQDAIDMNDEKGELLYAVYETLRHLKAENGEPRYNVTLEGDSKGCEIVVTLRSGNSYVLHDKDFGLINLREP